MTTSCRSGDLRIEPGEIKAFYCSMDETLWKNAGKVVFYDQEGNRYPVPISNMGLEILRVLILVTSGEVWIPDRVR